MVKKSLLVRSRTWASAMTAIALVGGLTLFAQRATTADPQTAVNSAFNQFKALKEGKNADYIPALARVDPNLFGIALVTAVLAATGYSERAVRPPEDWVPEPVPWTAYANVVLIQIALLLTGVVSLFAAPEAASAASTPVDPAAAFAAADPDTHPHLTAALAAEPSAARTDISGAEARTQTTSAPFPPPRWVPWFISTGRP